jgi:hypothetical protein
MFPGTTSKLSESNVASAATISPKSDLARVTGSTQINTINPPFAGFSGVLYLAPVDGAVVLGTSGNILVGITMAQNRLVTLVFSKLAAKWYIDNGV